jgi:hypothetical protein
VGCISYTLVGLSSVQIKNYISFVKFIIKVSFISWTVHNGTSKNMSCFFILTLVVEGSMHVNCLELSSSLCFCTAILNDNSVPFIFLFKWLYFGRNLILCSVVMKTVCINPLSFAKYRMQYPHILLVTLPVWVKSVKFLEVLKLWVAFSLLQQ